MGRRITKSLARSVIHRRRAATLLAFAVMIVTIVAAILLATGKMMDDHITPSCPSEGTSVAELHCADKPDSDDR